MLGKAQNAFSSILNFLRLAVFKILQFKVNHISRTSVLPFYRYYDKRLTCGKLAKIYLIAANLQYLTLYVILATTLPKTLIESYKHAVSF